MTGATIYRWRRRWRARQRTGLPVRQGHLRYAVDDRGFTALVATLPRPKNRDAWISDEGSVGTAMLISRRDAEHMLQELDTRNNRAMSVD